MSGAQGALAKWAGERRQVPRGLVMGWQEGAGRARGAIWILNVEADQLDEAMARKHGGDLFAKKTVEELGDGQREWVDEDHEDICERQRLCADCEGVARTDRLRHDLSEDDDQD